MNQNESLASAVASCDRCRLVTDRGSGFAVPAMPGADYQPGGIALFLEAPGADEEKPQVVSPEGRWGKPLVGRAGKLMDALLLRAGLQRSEILVLNRIRCRPVRNRIVDYPDAVSQCDEWVKKELEAYQPSVVVLCGNTALHTVFGATSSITATRGSVRCTSNVFPYGARTWTATFHPSYALRNGGENTEAGRAIIDDLALAKELLSANLC